VRVLAARDDALLIELGSLEEAVALAASLRDDPVPGVGEVVPGARTLLVPFDPWATTPSALASALRARPLVRGDVGGSREVEVATVYDGEDLAAVAELLGWSAEELVRRHTSARFTVGFVGFAPGFAYLLGDDPDLVVPRRATPRTRVPAGSVAMAGPYSGVYPRESPGGWQLVGRTDLVVFDVERDPPAIWQPGDRVRFVAVRAAASGSTSQPVPTPAGQVGSSAPVRQFELPNADGAAEVTPSAASLEVVSPGLQAVVEDLGRHGHAATGVSTSGAVDARSLRAANRAVGNPVGAAAIEATGGGLRLRAHGRVVAAAAGALVPIGVRPADGEPWEAPLARPVVLDDGDELELGPPSRGIRAYVAVRGGLDVPAVLGSRSTDLLAGLGPAPLTAGTVLRCGRTHSARVGVAEVGDVGARDPSSLPAPGDVVELRLVLGPRDDWFDDAALALLAAQEWEVTERSNRVGLRLAGAEPLRRAGAYEDAELPSEGCVTGALQVPPDGQPVLFLADHPLTGGYPVVGAVRASDVGLAGQLPPGARLRFRLEPLWA
jgi:KipI family sensor histidine kinase inhibitor